MKTTIKFLMLTTLGMSLLTSQAYAMTTKQRRLEEAPESRLVQGIPSSAVKANFMGGGRTERFARRVHKYWSKVGYPEVKVEPFNRLTDVSEYPFPQSRFSAERGGYVFSRTKH